MTFYTSGPFKHSQCLSHWWPSWIINFQFPNACKVYTSISSSVPTYIWYEPGHFIDISYHKRIKSCHPGTEIHTPRLPYVTLKVNQSSWQIIPFKILHTFWKRYMLADDLASVNSNFVLQDHYKWPWQKINITDKQCYPRYCWNMSDYPFWNK